MPPGREEFEACSANGTLGFKVLIPEQPGIFSSCRIQVLLDTARFCWLLFLPCMTSPERGWSPRRLPCPPDSGLCPGNQCRIGARRQTLLLLTCCFRSLYFKSVSIHVLSYSVSSFPRRIHASGEQRPHSSRPWLCHRCLTQRG